MRFDIMDLQKGRGKVQARSRADEGRAVLKYIDVDDLVPSEDNFYSMSAIDELAALIELSGGVKQPGLVVPLGGGKYRVIAGHRRRLASLQLVKQGKEAFRKMPCMVEADEHEPGADAEADELRAIDEAILLIATNGQRDKTDWDKVQEVTRLRALLDRKRQFEKIPGETRKLIAEQLGTTPAQVGRYDSIERKLAAPFKSLLERGKVNISVAYELSTLPKGEQYAAYDEFNTKGGLSIEDVKRRKADMEEKEKLRAASASGTMPPQGATLVIGDEMSPAPTQEQYEEILERAKDRPASGAVVLPGKPEGNKDTQKVERDEATAEGNTGKVVGFPHLPLAPPTEAEQEKEKTEWAELLLKDLRNYCETMSAVKGERKVPWADYADALSVAIDALWG